MQLHIHQYPMKVKKIEVSTLTGDSRAVINPFKHFSMHINLEDKTIDPLQHFSQIGRQNKRPLTALQNTDLYSEDQNSFPIV